MNDPGLDDKEFKRDTPVSISVRLNLNSLVGLTGVKLVQNTVIASSTEKFSAIIITDCQDLSSYNRLILSMQNLSDVPLLVGVTLRHGPSDLMEHDRFATSFSGGRESLLPRLTAQLKFPIECFGIYGKPSGWKDVTSLTLSIASEKFFVGPKSFSVAIYYIEFDRILPPQGPRLTSLGLERITIKPVKRKLALSKNRFFGANGLEPLNFVKGYVSPFSGNDPGLSIPAPHNYPQENSEEIMNGKIMGQNVSETIQWTANPLGELEWTHFLNRHHFLRPLILEYAQTQDRTFAEKVSSVVTSWIEKCPTPLDSNGGAGPTWETLTVAWRLREWFWIKGVMWSTGHFSHDTVNLMLRSVWEHARSLMDHQGHPNNWIIVESAALAVTGALFPEFQESGGWWKTGISRLQKAIELQFFGDGSHFEISPLYHSICLNALLEVQHVANANKLQLNEAFVGSLKNAFEFLMEIARPDFTWPSINDSGSIERDYIQLFQKLYILNKRPEYLWFASTGKRGKPPKSGVRVFKDAGICVIRRNESCNLQWAILRAGPPGAFHIHSDLLSVELFDKDTKWLLDPGITSYAPSALTDYYRSAGSHNSFVVDGVEPDRTQLPVSEKIISSKNIASELQNHDFIGATGQSREFSDGCDNRLFCSRTLLLFRNSYWAVIDHIEGSGTHDVTHNWQFSTEVKKVEACGKQSVVASSHSAKMLLQKMLPVASSEIEYFLGSINPYSGWVSSRGKDHRSHSVKFNTRVKLPITFFWVMRCMRNDTGPFPSLSLERDKSGKTSLIIRHKIGTFETLDLPKYFQENLFIKS
ncbi:MAG: heparinase II/III family protein [Pseudomonadota bacterium]